MKVKSKPNSIKEIRRKKAWYLIKQSNHNGRKVNLFKWPEVWLNDDNRNIILMFHNN